MALMKIIAKSFGEIACVESHPTKASALDAMAVEDGFADFAAYCAFNRAHDRKGWTKREAWNRFEVVEA